jgi:hypothetical protein
MVQVSGVVDPELVACWSQPTPPPPLATVLLLLFPPVFLVFRANGAEGDAPIRRIVPPLLEYGCSLPIEVVGNLRVCVCMCVCVCACPCPACRVRVAVYRCRYLYLVIYFIFQETSLWSMSAVFSQMVASVINPLLPVRVGAGCASQGPLVTSSRAAASASRSAVRGAESCPMCPHLCITLAIRTSPRARQPIPLPLRLLLRRTVRSQFVRVAGEQHL